MIPSRPSTAASTRAVVSLVAAERVDQAEDAEQQQVDAGDQREREQRDVRVDEREDARRSSPSTPATIRIVPNWRTSPRSSASTGVVVVMPRCSGSRGVSGGHTARVISTDSPGSRIASRTSGASSAACSANSRAGSPAGPVADAAVGAPVDRHRERGLQQRAAPAPPRAGPCGPGRSSAPSRRSAAARRRASRQARHLRVRLGVAGEVDAARRRSRRRSDGARTGCAGRRGWPAPPRCARRPARARRRRRACAPCGRLPRSAADRGRRRHDRRLRVEPAQRRLVEVVVVGVREQDRVEPPDVAGHGRLAPQVRDARAQQRVGDQARAPELEQHGRVPEPGQHPRPSRPILARGAGAALHPARVIGAHPGRARPSRACQRRNRTSARRSRTYRAGHTAASPSRPPWRS